MYYHPAPYYSGGSVDGRKQQKRHTAGSFFGGLIRRKSSTAQPRPRILVPPGVIGPVCDFNENDVLCGRGGRINSHIGNVQFRELVQMNKISLSMILMCVYEQLICYCARVKT